jgi:hypothetical protein
MSYVYIYVCNIMYVISLTTIEKQQKRQGTIDIHLLARGNRAKNRILLVGGFECHLSSLTLSLSLSIIPVRRLILLYPGKK